MLNASVEFDVHVRGKPPFRLEGTEKLHQWRCTDCSTPDIIFPARFLLQQVREVSVVLYSLGPIVGYDDFGASELRTRF